MTTFTIDSDNNISAFAEAPAAADQIESFSSEKELAKLTANWPASRLVDTWNSFAGVAPFDELKGVKKFTNRKAAVGRIWKAVQRLTPTAAPQAARVATKTAGSKKSTPKAEGRVTARERGTEARDGSKKATVLELLRRPGGATSRTSWRRPSGRPTAFADLSAARSTKRWV